MPNFFYEYVDGNVFKVELEDGEKLPIRGKRISSFLEDDKILKEKEFYFITKQLLDILGEMRSVFPPILHKNITPSNIIVKKDWEIALIGFNGVKQNEEYMAPEALSFPTPKSDLYSVGMVLLNLLGNESFNKDFKKFIEKIINSNPDNRFKDVNTAKLILEKIENNSIKDSDWNIGSRASYSEGINTFDEERLVQSQFNHSVENLDIVISTRGYHSNSRRHRGYDNPILNIIGGIVILAVMFGTYFINNDDECDTAPRDYYNDEECNLHPKSQEEIKSDIIKRNRKDKEIRKRWKKSGITGKIGGE